MALGAGKEGGAEEPVKAQITIEGAEDLYREIRVGSSAPPMTTPYAIAPAKDLTAGQTALEQSEKSKGTGSGTTMTPRLSRTLMHVSFRDTQLSKLCQNSGR